MDILLVKQQTKQMIDDLKAVCANFGLGNASSEYKIITEVFLYKFLCDKFIYEIRKANPEFSDKSDADVQAALKTMSEDEYELALFDIGASTARIRREYFIASLFNQQDTEGFHTTFDNALVGIANDNVDIFSMQAGGKSKVRLFDPISHYVTEIEKQDSFCKAIIDKLAKSSFAGVFEQKYDFFADVFEYLVKDYNKDFGKYAEYYTPHSIATIIARIMVPDGAKDVAVYDPAAGTGTLVLALAHEIGEDNCTIFTQDISQKSNEFLRLNLILNNLVHSLPNVIQDDTLLTPRHLNAQNNGVMLFDYIVSNPPFNVDFSETRVTLAGKNYQKRFFAGVPKIPNKDKDDMAIYLMFLQHIITSLSDTGSAAIVVPTGFLTANQRSNKIAYSIHEYLISHHMLRGVISMPSNVFATTGTNVSVLFIEKEHQGSIVLMDASKMGSKIKVDDQQRTILSDREIETIIETFNQATPVEDFCVLVSEKQIIEKKHSFNAGQYFDVKVEYVEVTNDEFTLKMDTYKHHLAELFSKGRKLEAEIQEQMERVRYE